MQLANSSTFPTSLDVFQVHQELQQSDLSAMQQYQALVTQTTPLTPSQQTTLTNLTNQLRQYLITAEDITHIQDAIYNTENFFLNNVNSYFNEFTYEGQWNPTVTYQKWNTITYAGQSYLCLQTSFNNEPDTATSYWALIAKQGSTGPQGPAGVGISFVGTYNSANSYSVNNAVQYQGSLYACIVAAPAGISPTNGSYWSLVVQANTDGGQIQAGTITNSALASDIKVGSLSLLNTTTKSDVVSAINEVYTDATNAIPSSQRGANNGVATLDASGHVPQSQLANGVTSFNGSTGAITGVSSVNGQTGVVTVQGYNPLTNLMAWIG